jgi:malate dehydrogenase (oxaloacetate-decarboxylating)
VLIVTDSEGILGIGDQGVGGISICIGKLSVYTAAAGIHPAAWSPVVLDVGTDNLKLLNNELYLGERHARVRGERYDEFIDDFVRAAPLGCSPTRCCTGRTSGPTTRTGILGEVPGPMSCTFNDDIQGTAAVVTSAVLAGVKRQARAPARTSASSCMAAGPRAIGIADLLVDLLVKRGAHPRAGAHAVLGDKSSRGLVTDDAHAAVPRLPAPLRAQHRRARRMGRRRDRPHTCCRTSSATCTPPS